MGQISADATAQDTWSPTPTQKLLAWSTHLFTATGAVWALLAVLAINEEQWRLAFVWMGIAVFVDSVDGFAARAAHVKTVLPGFDGALLDNIVDYINYVFVPAYFLYMSSRLPPQISLAVVCTILLASAYQFSQVDAKTEDHYFTGFPSYWNIVAFYMMITRTAIWLNALILMVLAILVFVPIKYIYPSRTSLLPKLTAGFGFVWTIANLAILWQYPNYAQWLVWASLSYAVYYAVLSLYATVRT